MAIITAVYYPHLKSQSQYGAIRSHESCFQETLSLTKAIDTNIQHSAIVPLAKYTAAYVFTKGKLEEIKEAILFHKIELVIVSIPMTPVQQRNLEKFWNVKVIDRTGLILEIFSQRAATREGVLQVDLAMAEYQKSRLVKAWNHLERQRGGGGFIGGPGETQKENDRRMLDDKVKKIKKQLQEVVKTRELHRKSRKKIPYPIVSLVGYTNAGKSTLFNKLTKAKVLEADMLFATLDPTMRQIQLNSGEKIILSDTVGFISELPTQLIAAFRATLEEVIEADLIIHVRDISHSDSLAQKKDVEKLLEELGVKTTIIEVHNKIDQVEDYDEHNNIIKAIPISALNGKGLNELQEAITNHFRQFKIHYALSLPSTEGAIIAWLHKNTEILSELYDEDKVHYKIVIDKKNLGILQNMLKF